MLTDSVVIGMAQSYNLFLYLASKSYNKGQKKQARGLLVYPRCDAPVVIVGAYTYAGGIGQQRNLNARQPRRAWPLVGAVVGH